MAILTVDEFREHVSTSLEDDAVQRLLDAAEAEIVRYAGAPGSASEVYTGQGRFITLASPAASIASVTEYRSGTTTTLAADDYFLYPSGLVLERITGGTHPWHCWRGRAVVTYVPADDADIRIGVQLDLVNLALNFEPGKGMEVIGAWTEQFAQAASANRQLFDDILSRLDVGPSLLVVQ
jgi:hypothetical protein